MITARALKFNLGSGRSEWYSADTPFGVKYIVIKNAKGGWEYIRPNCGSSPVNRPNSETIELAFRQCQNHFDKIVRECL